MTINQRDHVVGLLDHEEWNLQAVQTCRLQGRNVFDYMTQALTTWLAGTSPPSLVPEHLRAAHATA